MYRYVYTHIIYGMRGSCSPDRKCRRLSQTVEGKISLGPVARGRPYNTSLEGTKGGPKAWGS